MHTNTDTDTDTDLEKLTADYCASFPEKKVQLEEAFRQIIQNNWSKESLIALKYLAHKLSGSTGLYGFTKLSDLIQSLEKAIDRFKQSNAEKETISETLTDILEQFDLEISH